MELNNIKSSIIQLGNENIVFFTFCTLSVIVIIIFFIARSYLCLGMEISIKS